MENSTSPAVMVTYMGTWRKRRHLVGQVVEHHSLTELGTDTVTNITVDHRTIAVQKVVMAATNVCGLT